MENEMRIKQIIFEIEAKSQCDSILKYCLVGAYFHILMHLAKKFVQMFEDIPAHIQIT